MIKILNIISDSNIGGAGRCLLNFLKYYDRKKFAVKVVVPKGSLLKAEIEKLKTKLCSFILIFINHYVILINIGNRNKQMWFATFNPQYQL